VTKKLAGAVVNHLGVLDTYAFLKSKHIGSQVVIITYHRISDKKDDWYTEKLSPESFERQVEYICQNYEILSLNALISYILEKKTLPKKAATITLDDGYKDNYVYAYPILRRYHVPATMFLATGHVGTADLFWWDKVRYVVEHTKVERIRLAEAGDYVLESALDRRVAGYTISQRLRNLSEQRKNLLVEELLNVAGVDIPSGLGKELILSWNEVRKMSGEGIDFGAHTVSHPILTELPLGLARREIVESKKHIEEAIGKPANFFSYPSGIFNDEIVKIVSESGFVGAVTTNPKWITPRTNPYKLGRMAVSQDYNLFRVILSGLAGDLPVIWSLRT
jgi:peptidoglycan/xylan/chitin deacetylase (PgdA/CDA1 family)